MTSEIEQYEHEGKHIFSFSICESSDLEPYSHYFTNSAVLLIIVLENIPNEEQRKISDVLVKNGCRYAVCYGDNCKTWDDSIDWSSISMNSVESREDHFVMTTWHEEGSLNDVVFYFLNDTIFDDWRPEKYIVLSINTHNDLNQQVRQLIEKRAYLD